jgi:hypothetical protein
MGLLFIAYQADLQAGFITVQKRLDGEPLEEYIKPIGGGTSSLCRAYRLAIIWVAACWLLPMQPVMRD